MAQENDTDMNTSFSTLNVNAMEFVPSFCTAPTPTTINTDENDETITTPIAAIPTETISDKTPENVESDPLDSWDVEEEPVSTPDDDELGDLEDAEEGAIKIAKKKMPKVEESKSKKEHVNVVFIGHVDAGKSTIGGQIMSLTGMVDKRTLEKYEREAREKSRESWYLSWALDTNQEERDKGKTVEVGRAYFETERKHFTILDAPGHKSFVPNMIGGAAQADLAVLVLSARKGEFETGFDRGGQTREHAMLAKTAGVKHLVVLVNKMDDPTVNWDKSRFNECRDKILPYLKKLGFNPVKDLTFMPVSGLNGLGLLDQINESICPWYRGSAFIPFIDDLPSLNRKLEGPFIMPIVDKYKDMGTVVMGKVESGCAKKGQNLLVMPNRTQVSIDQIWSDDEEVTAVSGGENVKIKLKGIEEEDVSPGFVLCDATQPIKTGKKFDAQVVILEHKSIICAGYSAVMHIHCAAEEITVNALICLVDKKTGEKSKTRPRFVKQDQVAIMRIECSGLICLEQFKLFPQMGRFTLRDENLEAHFGLSSLNVYIIPYKILPYLKKLGFNPVKDLTFMPVSGLNGLGLLDQINESICPWYRGSAFIPFIDDLPSLNRKLEGPFIMPIVDKYKDMGTVVMGKVESGCAKKGQNLLVMPNRTQVSIDQIWSDDEEVTAVSGGENVKIKLKGIEEEDVSPGFVLCDATQPIKTGKKFDAQVVILEHKSIICAGYSAVMHIHCAAEEITVNALICLVDKKTGEKSKTRPRFVKQDQVAIMRIECSGLICLEQFKLFPQMGRFTLRDENKTIAIGKVLKVIE